MRLQAKCFYFAGLAAQTLFDDNKTLRHFHLLPQKKRGKSGRVRARHRCIGWALQFIIHG